MTVGSPYLPKWRIFALPVCDSVLFYIGLTASMATWLSIQEPHDVLQVIALLAPIVMVWTAVLRMLDLYDLRTVRDLPAMVQNLLISAVAMWALGSVYFDAIGHWFPLATHISTPAAILAAFPFLVLFRRGWLTLCDFHLEDEKVVFLGDRQHVRILQEGLEQLSSDTGFAPVEWGPDVDLVVADSEWVDDHWDDARAVFLAAVRQKKPIISFESFYESLLGKVSPAYASSPSWTLEFAFHEHLLYPSIKRVLDVAIAGALLVAAAPVMALISAAIWAFDGRPIFYGQKRVGHMCRTFTIWKFRTMKVCADATGPFTSAKTGESLVTRVGYWLRRFRMDELPQLWNVFAGEMSLVGPRPEWTEEIRIIEKHIPNYHLRHLVRPGITGWAQVYFRATNNFHDSAEKLHYDLYYLKYFSAALDISILLKTVKRLFVSDSRVRARPSLAARPIGNHHWVSDFIRSTAGEQPVQKRPAMATLLQTFIAAIVAVQNRISCLLW